MGASEAPMGKGLSSCRWPQRPPTSPLIHAGLAGSLPCWAWHKSPTSRDGRLGTVGLLRRVGPSHSPHSRAWVLQTQASRCLPCSSAAPPVPLTPTPGPPASGPASHGSDLFKLPHCPLGCPFPPGPPRMPTACLSTPSYLPLRSAPNRLGVPVSANPQPSPGYEASRATQPLTTQKGSTALSLPPEEHTHHLLGGGGVQGAALRGHTHHLLGWGCGRSRTQRNTHIICWGEGCGRSRTHVFGKEGLLLLRVLGLLGLLHLQALNEGRSLRAKHGREGAR